MKRKGSSLGLWLWHHLALKTIRTFAQKKQIASICSVDCNLTRNQARAVTNGFCSLSPNAINVVFSFFCSIDLIELEAESFRNGNNMAKEQSVKRKNHINMSSWHRLHNRVDNFIQCQYHIKKTFAYDLLRCIDLKLSNAWSWTIRNKKNIGKVWQRRLAYKIPKRQFYFLSAKISFVYAENFHVFFHCFGWRNMKNWIEKNANVLLNVARWGIHVWYTCDWICFGI